MNQIEIDKLVDELMKDLFSYGHTGEAVDRLALITQNGRDLGGWGRAPIRAKLVGLAQKAAGVKPE